MVRKIDFRSTVLALFMLLAPLCSFDVVAETTTELFLTEHVAVMDQHPIDQRKGNRKVKSYDEYLNSRVKTITELTAFSLEEEKVLREILKKYDEAKFAIWKERNRLLGNLRTKAPSRVIYTEAEYKDVLTKLEELTKRSAKAEAELISDLNTKLTPEQAVYTYMGMRGFNSRMGRELHNPQL